MSRRLFQSVIVLLLLLLAPALDWVEGSRVTAASRTDASTVVFLAHDYGFAGPDRIPAGVITMQVVNKGQDPHHIQLLKLVQGKTADDFRAAITAEPARLPHWIQFVGGPNAVLPGSESVATMNLAEGEYLLICLIPNKEGVPHMALGMQKPLSVKGGKPTLVSEPKAGLTITLVDFRLMLSQPITAGSHTIQVINHGTMPHEVVVLKLDPGASAKDFGAAFEPGASGPPPGKPVGGVVGLETGAHAFFTAQFEPGRYGLICFFPDPISRTPHFTKGMALDFTVQ
jgi:uncharacterized cupredoxin-like copper-binding protein